MSNEEILKKAIEKAVEGGYDRMKFICLTFSRGKTAGKYKSIKDMKGLPYECLIFSHSFAKAFFGEEQGRVVGKADWGLAWEYHLQQMVLEEEPLKYIERFLTKEGKI